LISPAELNDGAVLYRLVSKIVHVTAAVGVLALSAQALVIVADVLMRWLLGAPLLGAIDIYQLLNILVIAAFIPLVVFEGRNIKIKVFGGVKTPRLAACADVFADLCTLLFLVIAVWQCGRHALQVSHELTPILELPVAPAWWAGCALLLVCVPAQFVVCVLRFRTARFPGSSASRGAGV
jgi:TRAP-type C4-dicarboxylate transport system permease small subunit